MKNSYYCANGFEVIDIIEAFDLNFSRGNALKYLLRAGKKDDEIKDLEKAIDYLQHEVERLKKKS